MFRHSVRVTQSAQFQAVFSIYHHPNQPVLRLAVSSAHQINQQSLTPPHPIPPSHHVTSHQIHAGPSDAAPLPAPCPLPVQRPQLLVQRHLPRPTTMSPEK